MNYEKDRIFMPNKQNGDFCKKLQDFIAVTSIGASAMRNQGKGVLEKAQDFCAGLDLSKYSCLRNQGLFLKMLDKDTNKLLTKFSLKTRPWGVARKALNLFLRSATYNAHLRIFHKLRIIESFLEIPLDSIVAKELKKNDKRRILPKWQGLKLLTHKESDLFQNFAQQLAVKQRMHRIHLDVFLWTANR